MSASSTEGGENKMNLFTFRKASALAGGETAGATGARRANVLRQPFAARGAAAARQQAAFARALTRGARIQRRAAQRGR